MLLEHGDVMFDLVELSRHPAVLLVHMDALSQRHTGGHWLQDVNAESSSISSGLSITKGLYYIKTDYITQNASEQIPFSLTLFPFTLHAQKANSDLCLSAPVAPLSHILIR